MAETQRAPRGRITRQPIATRGRLNVKGKEPGYVYRFVNDIGDRIEMFQQAGYEVVTKDKHKIGDNRLDIAGSEGSAAAVTVGVKPNGDGQKAVLMRTKQEYYDEDQEAKQAEIRAVQEQIKKPNLEGTYGSIETEDRRGGKLPD